ncbi:MAG: glycosyltransferase, partial [Deltaproteobacteria bacterium]|nr:glycosyltransferase [Deltaproteobacteria bacterium]
MNPALICLPTYNERDNLEPITRAILAADPRVDILVVDDNSPDGTGALADTLAAAEPRIRVLHREKKEGLGRAYVAAFKWAL